MNENNEQLETEAVRFGYIGLYSHCDTVQEALEYGLSVAKATGDQEAHVTTALMVIVNTYALAQAQQHCVMKELEEMARAALSYCQDGSKSDRRRMRMIEGAQSAIAAAEPYIKDGS